jgi:hypothetical protein
MRQTKLVVGCAYLSKQRPDAYAHRFDECEELLTGRRHLEVFNDSGSTPVRLIMANALREVPQLGLR